MHASNSNNSILFQKRVDSALDELKQELLGLSVLYAGYVNSGWDTNKLVLIVHENGGPALKYYVEKEWAEWYNDGTISGKELLERVYLNGESLS